MYENSPLIGIGFTPESAASIERAKAANFAYDRQAETVLFMRDNDPSAFDALSPAMKIAAGYYAESKAAAKAHGIDVTGGAK
ncbi:hypothetical protein [Streptomyces sp. DSM 40907]|uniref:hypothetical protein n=1 Tax=Streptomyces kutzneri TaxID=3051179 RepID=UPI0028D47DC7|nr:hypothetical protein [Streptomyces sp. DSM 40907]